MIYFYVTGPHLSRQPLAPNKMVQTCQEETTGNETILYFWRESLPPSTLWHTDITQCQGNCQQKQHLRCIIYFPSWGIGWWPKNMIKYHVTKKASISTLNGIVYTGMYKYGDARSYKNKITTICTFIYTCALVMHWINRPFMNAKVDHRVSWWSGGKNCYQLLHKILDKQIVL